MIFLKFSRKIRGFYIPNLMLYIVITNALVFFLTQMEGFQNLHNYLALIPAKVMDGEVWRLLTFIFIPQANGVFSLFFFLYLYYMAGSGLEHEWGGFKFNMYYLCGMVVTIIFSFIVDNVIGFPISALYASTFLNLSLFLAFARLYPDMELLLFFILPIKIKYLALFNWLIILYDLFKVISNGQYIISLLIIAPVINFLIFFGKDIVVNGFRRGSSIKRKAEFKAAMPKEKEYFHKCTVCGITDVDDPDMEFRYCSKCSGKHGYCMNHINNHEHL